MYTLPSLAGEGNEGLDYTVYLLFWQAGSCKADLYLVNEVKTNDSISIVHSLEAHD